MWKVVQKPVSAHVVSMGKVHAFLMLVFWVWLLWVTCALVCMVFMVMDSWSVYSDMEESGKSVQSEGKRRSQADKVGRLKYLLQQNKEVKAELCEIKLMLRTIYRGLKPQFSFDCPLVERLACDGEVDREILQVLFEAGASGVLPKDVAKRLVRFGLERFQVSRRIVRMNRRLEKALGERVAERRGWRWALTGFVVEAWGKTGQDVGASLSVVSESEEEAWK